jgi:hypothetical protein
MSKFEDNINAVLGGVFAKAAEGNRSAFEAISEREDIIKAVEALKEGDFGVYEFLIFTPMERFAAGLAESVFPGNTQLQFLAKEIRFFQRHLGETIKEVEGWSCYNDKTQKVTRALLQFFLTGKEIVWDYDAEYTYTLPRKVFVAHDEIVSFFDAIHFLFHGRPEKYLAFRASLDRLKPQV